VKSAVVYLESTPDPVELFKQGTGFGRVAGPGGSGRRRRARRAQIDASEAFIDRIPAPMLLAMEMAAHEDVDRRAMEGELAILEEAWRQAEEIAGIADNLLLPADVDAEFKSMATADATKV